MGALELTGMNFFDCEPESELNAAEDIPEYVDVDVAVDSGAGDRCWLKQTYQVTR